MTTLSNVRCHLYAKHYHGSMLSWRMHDSDPSVVELVMIGSDNRPWWTLTHDDQKRMVEDAIDWYLRRDAELTDRQKLLLRDAISNAYRGRYGMAIQDIVDAGLPETDWSPQARIDPGIVVDITLDSLRRGLQALSASPVRQWPTFR